MGGALSDESILDKFLFSSVMSKNLERKLDRGDRESNSLEEVPML